MGAPGPLVVVTLAQRLITSLSLLVLLATSALGWFVHRSWREAEEAQFESEFSRAQKRLATQLDSEVSELPRLLEPLCEHSQMVDDPLLSLESGGVPPDRRHALNLLVRDTTRAYRFDEFILFTNEGEILGAHDASLVGTKRPDLAAVKSDKAHAELVVESGIPKVRAQCAKREGQVGIGLMAARHLGELLERVGAFHGLRLSLTPPAVPTRYLAKVTLPLGKGFAVYATPERSWLDAALARSTRAILLWGALTLGGALVVGWLFARRLSIPIEQLAAQVQHALDGEPQPVRARGAREIVRFAEAFNRAIEDLAALRKRLAASERLAAQREIAQRVAHEIKNPLMPIRAAMETLRRLRRRDDPKFDAYFDEATATVLSEVQRITTIVNEFTQFARMPAPSPGEVELVPLLQSLCGLHRHDGVVIRLDASGEVPVIRADRDQLIQVFTNLLQNALDAVSETAEPQVVVTVSSSTGDVEVSVTDNGPGIAPLVRDRLFQPYVTGKAHGTGLGLAIAHNIVTEHGGSIECVQAEGSGARFVVTLPVSGPVTVGRRQEAPPKRDSR
jgi:signal transduction histidine kinase